MKIFAFIEFVVMLIGIVLISIGYWFPPAWLLITYMAVVCITNLIIVFGD